MSRVGLKSPVIIVFDHFMEEIEIHSQHLCSANREYPPVAPHVDWSAEITFKKIFQMCIFQIQHGCVIYCVFKSR